MTQEKLDKKAKLKIRREKTRNSKLWPKGTKRLLSPAIPGHSQNCTDSFIINYRNKQVGNSLNTRTRFRL